MKYIIALDQGTTSSRVVIYDLNYKMIIKVQEEFAQIYPKQGFVEHDPILIWTSILKLCNEAMKKLDLNFEDIYTIGITNQRETTILWDKLTGKPVYNAIVWQCNRTSDYCDILIEQGYNDIIREKTGLKIDPYFSATKIKWILDNVEEAKALLKKGRLLFGTVDSWLLWNFTNHLVHATDYSNASRTMLFNIHTLTWDEELLKLFNIPKSILPVVKNSFSLFGYTSLLGGKIPITGILGDQQASLYGQKCYQIGNVKATYGTGSFLLMNVGNKLVDLNTSLVQTIAWKINDKVTYAIEGSIFVAGSVIKWLRDEIKILKKVSDSSIISEKLEDNGGVYLVPAFQGLGAPYWDYNAKGTIIGLTRTTTKDHLIRAALESIAYQIKDVITLIENKTQIKINNLNVDGGASANDFLMQFQSDILATNVIRPKNIEITSLGAAMIATANNITKEEKEFDLFTPNMKIEEVNKLYKGWLNAIEHTKSNIDEEKI